MFEETGHDSTLGYTFSAREDQRFYFVLGFLAVESTKRTVGRLCQGEGQTRESKSREGGGGTHLRTWTDSSSFQPHQRNPSPLG